jgi:hypothetical protein
MGDRTAEQAVTSSTVEGFGLFGMGVAQRLALVLAATLLLAAASWWAVAG